MDKNINIIISAVDKATAPLKKVGANLTNFAKKNEAAFQGMAVAGGVITAGILGIGGAFVNTAAKFETYNVALKNALGSQDKATESMKLLKDISKDTPFELEELTKSYIGLVNRGFKPTRKEIISLGDLASSQGKGFNQLTEALLDAQTGEFERLKEFGVRASVEGDRVAFTFKGVTTEVDKTSESIGKYITGLGNLQGVQGGMEEQSKTLSGRMSTLRDTFGNISLEVGNKLLPVLTPMIEKLTVIIEKVGEWIGENPKLTVAILIIIGVIGGLLTVLGTLGLVLPSIITGVRLFSLAIAGIGGPITLLISLIAILVGVVIKNWDTIKWYTVYLVDSVKTKFSEMYDSLKSIFEKVRLVFTVVWEGIKLAVTGIIDSMIDSIKSRFKSIGDFVSNTVNAIGKMGDKVGNIGGGIKSGLSNLINGQRALGGTVQAGKSYLVGERGPEIYTPATTGRIQNQPSNSMGVNINLGGVVINNSQDENRLIQKMKVALMEESRKFNLGIVV